MINLDLIPTAVAVYGSLRTGCSLPNQPDLASRLRPLGRCVIGGLLYDLGDYPGLVPGDGRVVGELYEPRDAAVLELLDLYEQYDPLHPSRSEYVRRAVRLIEPPVDAWVYYFVGDTRGRSRVSCADWLDHLRRRVARRA
jgi:gamma-glutamylcyclotransferase (GGCT)/AIG2-like uncharacterized protein YtfP